MKIFFSSFQNSGKYIISLIENQPLSVPTFLVSFISILVLRLILENTLELFTAFNNNDSFLLFQFAHIFFFFSISAFVSFFLLRVFYKLETALAGNIILVGTLSLALLPPILDWILSGGKGFQSYYEFASIAELVTGFFTFLGVDPLVGITPGPRIAMIISLILFFSYGYIKTGHIGKPFACTFAFYILFFILGTFPSLLTIAILIYEKSLLLINGTDVAAVFLTPISLFSSNLVGIKGTLMLKLSLFYATIFTPLAGLFLFVFFRKTFLALYHNARIPQMIYHGGIFLLGLTLGGLFTKGYFPTDIFHTLATFLLAVATLCTWLTSVVVNDFYDTNTDILTNTNRPLIMKTIDRDTYRIFGWIFFILSLFFAVLVSTPAFLFLLAYQGIAFLYSAPPLRLKRLPIVATGLSSVAILLIFFAGYVTASPEKNIYALPIQIPIFLFLAFVLVLPIKDFKDVRGDKRDGVYTLPVLLGEGKAKLVIGSFLLLLYVVSPLILSARSLFLPALFFGSLSFWSMQKGNENEKSFFSFRKLPGIILAITVFYGLTIFFLLF